MRAYKFIFSPILKLLIFWISGPWILISQVLIHFSNFRQYPMEEKNLKNANSRRQTKPQTRQKIFLSGIPTPQLVAKKPAKHPTFVISGIASTHI